MKKITASQAFSRGWEIFKQNALQHIGVFFLVGVILWIITLVLMPAGSMNFKGFNMSPEELAAMQQARPSFLSMLILFIVEIVAYMFLYGYTLDVVRNQYKGLGEVFSKYVRGSVFLNILIFGIGFFLAAIAIFIPLVLLSYVFQSGSFLTFALIFGYLFVLYLAIRLFFVKYLLVDGYDFADALKISWQKTRPYIGEIILFIIIAVALAFLGLLVLIIGLLVTIPIIYLAQAVFYNEVVSEPADETPATEVLEQ